MVVLPSNAIQQSSWLSWPDLSIIVDRNDFDQQNPDPGSDEALPATAPGGPVVVSVCVTCKTSDGALAGPAMFDAIQVATGDRNAAVQVRRVQCLSVCKRPTTVAVSSSDGYTFLFGDLQPEGAGAVVSFVDSYRKSIYGLVPWRERAEILRKGMVARLPPVRWSPEDGGAPK
jgi:predicted metal-binding protein